jgi:hypothetical protein
MDQAGQPRVAADSSLIPQANEPRAKIAVVND